MKSPKTVWILLLLGTCTTLLSMNVGLASLLRERGVSDAARDAFFTDLLNDDFMRAPVQDSKVFTARRVGYAGDPSPLAAEFEGILRTPQAEDTLAHLAEHGRAGARLYALCGLTALRSSKFPRSMSSASTDTEVVAFLNGCSMSVTTVKAAATSRDFWRTCELLVEGARSKPTHNGSRVDGERSQE